MRSLLDWLDHRLGYRQSLRPLRERVLPNGPSWWFCSASCLLWLLLIESVTGLLLMATYSPSMASAWASVNFIDQSSAGRFVRAVHHYTSHALIILLALHLLRVLLTGAYRAPRELVWITGLLLIPLILVWTVTGNPLSASQKGISQIQVEGNILAATPLVGPYLQRILFGGHEVGNLTLTRLYFLHVGLLPLLVGVLGLVHLHQVIKHSPYRQTVATEGAVLPKLLPYWPYQSVRNMTALFVVVGAISWISWASEPHLSAPADPELSYSPRPEWYFRWLFELRRYFSGDTEFIATLVVPGAVLLAFMAAPFVDRFLSARSARLSRLLIVTVCAGIWGGLSYLSFHHDWSDPDYAASMSEFEKISDRVRELARTQSMPPAGAIELLRHDPLTQGPRLFSQHCNRCHPLTDSANNKIAAENSSAPNLHGFASAAWISGFLDVARISGPDYFANTAFRDGEMKQHIQSLFEEAGEPGRTALTEKLSAVAIALAAESGREPDDSPQVHLGRKLIVGELRCVECHKFRNEGSTGAAPDLTGYGSSEWLKELISDPSGERFYGGRNDRMPSFAADKVHADLNLLTTRELDLLVKWMTNSHRPHDIADEQSQLKPPNTPDFHVVPNYMTTQMSSGIKP